MRVLLSKNPVYLLAITLLFGLSPISSQEITICNEAASDADGDGWGWENNASCRIANDCVDSDGDGFGWNGFETCRVTEDATQQDAFECIDTDGDGWGWDGLQSCLIPTEPLQPDASVCVDSDGDGYGWDGSQTCIPDGIVSTEVGAESEIYLNRYETTTEGYWLASRFNPGWLGDAIYTFTHGWIDGDPGAPLVYTQGYYSNAVLCEDPDITMQDPSNPGLFFDATTGRTCATSGYFPIPAPEPVVFTEIGVEVLYENGNEWHCYEESRGTMDSPFVINGVNGGIEFDPSGNAKFSTNSNLFYSGSYRLDGASLQLGGGIRVSSYFKTNVSYQDGRLTLYRSGLSRLHCNRIVEENYPFSLYSADKAVLYRTMWNDYIGDSTPKAKLFSDFRQNYDPNSNFVKLQAEDIAGRTLSCLGLYGHIDHLGTQYGRHSTHETTYSITALGNDEYEFTTNAHVSNGGLEETVWMADSQGVFTRQRYGEYSKVFYRYTDDLYLLYEDFSGPFGSTHGTTVDVYACEVTASE